MAPNGGASPARIVRLLFLVAVYLLIAVFGANYVLGEGGFAGQPEQGLPPEGGAGPLETPPQTNPVAIAATVPPSPHPDGQASPDPEPDPEPDPLPESTPAPSPSPAPEAQPSPSPDAPRAPEPPPESAPPPASGQSTTPASTPAAEESSAAAAAPVSTISQPAAAGSAYTLGQGYSRNLRMSIVVTNNGGEEAKDIRVEVPLLGTLNSPYQVMLKETYSHAPVEITGAAQGGRIGHFHLSSLAPGAGVTLVIDYALRVHPFTAHFAAYTGGAAAESAGYRSPSPNIESDHSRIVAKAAELTAGKNGDLEKARAVYEFVQRHMHYDPSSPHRNKGALSALDTATGVCEEYAALFTALCRAAGIPARQVNGYTDPRGTGDVFNGTLALRGYRHSWAEFYLAGMGWLPADPTMNIGAETFKYFGSLPRASHIAQNYLDQSMRVKFSGGRLAVTWEEMLIQ